MDDTGGKLELDIKGMNCSHCSGSVQRTLSAMAGAQQVEVFLDEGRAVVRGTDLDVQALLIAVNGLGFEATES